MNDPGYVGTPTLERLCAEMIALRERNDRQHKLFEQTLSQLRDDLGDKFAQFTKDIQQAYQQLRGELTAEKRHSLGSPRCCSTRPWIWIAWRHRSRRMRASPSPSRKAQATLAEWASTVTTSHFGEEYRPALHERTGTERVEGLGPGRIARQLEPGFASSPGFRPAASEGAGVGVSESDSLSSAGLIRIAAEPVHYQFSPCRNRAIEGS